jgi:hypothetical protein
VTAQQAGGAFEQLVDIQRRGMRAAGAIVDRLIAAVDDARAAVTPDGDADDTGHGDQGVPVSAPARELAAAWLELIRQSIGGLSGMVPSNGDVATIDVSNGASPPLALTVDPAARRASGEVWLHNPTAEARAALQMHCGELRAHDGTSIPAALVVFDPCEVSELPARSSRGVPM